MTAEVDLRLLRSFVAVAEELHFGRAAARLHVSQPALSVQVRKLEHLVGVELLRRTSRHVELTPAGEVFLGEARRLLATAERAFAATREAARGSRGRLVVGFVGNGAAELTPRILSDFGAAHRHTEVEMRQFDFADPYAGLAEGSADAAFVRPPLQPREWLAMETLFVEPRVLVASERFGMAQAGSVRVEQLVDAPFVARRAPRYWRDFWLAADQREGQPVRVGAEAATVDECFGAILADRGVAFTQLSSQRFYARPGIAFVPVEGIPPTSVAIAWRRDAESPLVLDFVATALRAAALGSVPAAWRPGAPEVPEVALAG
jgi:DNA-binding transcriptional LysR family regulator